MLAGPIICKAVLCHVTKFNLQEASMCIIRTSYTIHNASCWASHTFALGIMEPLKVDVTVLTRLSLYMNIALQ